MTELRPDWNRLASELTYAVGTALFNIRNAIKFAPRPADDVGDAWAKGMNDALALLRHVEEKQDAIYKLLAEQLKQEPDGFVDIVDLARIQAHARRV